MSLEKKINDGEIKIDGKLSKNEIEILIKEIQNYKEFDYLKNEINSLKEFIENDVKNANERNLETNLGQTYIGEILQQLKSNEEFKTIYTELINNIGDENNNSKILGNKSVAIIQAGIKALSIKGEQKFVGTDGKELVIDGKTGINTYFATIQFQKYFKYYQNLGNIDGIMGEKTAQSLLSELKNLNKQPENKKHNQSYFGNSHILLASNQGNSMFDIQFGGPKVGLKNPELKKGNDRNELYKMSEKILIGNNFGTNYSDEIMGKSEIGFNLGRERIVLLRFHNKGKKNYDKIPAHIFLKNHPIYGKLIKQNERYNDKDVYCLINNRLGISVFHSQAERKFFEKYEEGYIIKENKNGKLNFIFVGIKKGENEGVRYESGNINDLFVQMML